MLTSHARLVPVSGLETPGACEWTHFPESLGIVFELQPPSNSCRFEWNKTVKVHGPDGLHLIGLDAKARKEIVATMDISKASCQYQEDHDAILEDIARQSGSVEAFNDALRLQLLLQPDSYKVRRGAASRLIMSRVL